MPRRIATATGAAAASGTGSMPDSPSAARQRAEEIDAETRERAVHDDPPKPPSRASRSEKLAAMNTIAANIAGSMSSES